MERQYKPRYSTPELRQANINYIKKYYYIGGGRERASINYYYTNYPELVGRINFDDSHNIKDIIYLIKDEVEIIKLERRLKMRAVRQEGDEE
jgi:hypothetical protein